MKTRGWDEEEHEWVVDCPVCEGTGHHPDVDGALCRKCGGVGRVRDEYQGDPTEAK